MLVGRAAADFENLGVVSCVDAVTGSVSGVAGQNGEVGAGDGEDGTTVVGIAAGLSEAWEGSQYRKRRWFINSRVKAVLSELAIVGCGRIVERVVGPVHEGVLAEHGSHFCGSDDGKDGDGEFARKEVCGGRG